MQRPATIQAPAAYGNYAIGRRNRISRITFHHIVGDAPAAINRFETLGIEVSATYVIGSDGQIYQCVDENNTPYTDANADSNSRTISIEHAGGNAAVPYTEAMYRASEQLVAYLIDKYGINDFKRHRDVSDTPTACPGQLDVERIVNNAKALLKGDDMVDDAGAREILTITGILAQPGDAPDRQPTLDEINNLIGKPYLQALQEVSQFEPYKHNLAKIKYYDIDIQTIGKQLKELQKTVSDPKSQEIINDLQGVLDKYKKGQ